jgi:hypothetical protein
MDEMSDMRFQPFEDAAGVFSVGGLQLENGLATIAMFGDLKIGRDQRSRRAALALADVLRAVADAIGEDAPESLAEEAVAVVDEVENPFH